MAYIYPAPGVTNVESTLKIHKTSKAADATGLSIPALQDVTVNAANDVFTWTQLDETGHGLPKISGKGVWRIREKQKGNKSARTVAFHPDGLWYAKDRSGVLGTWESPDLGAIIKKIGGTNV